MTEPKNDESEESRVGTLEHTDVGESLRQLWWTVAVTVVGMAVVAYFYL